jgi:hypothetical protein
MNYREKAGGGWVKIILTYEVDEMWATFQELSDMTDEQVIELVKEDSIELLDGATWIVQRQTEEN